MGISTARSHYDMHHKLEFSRGFNAFDHQQVKEITSIVMYVVESYKITWFVYIYAF